jgi:hypothetical protein
MHTISAELKDFANVLNEDWAKHTAFTRKMVKEITEMAVPPLPKKYRTEKLRALDSQVQSHVWLRDLLAAIVAPDLVVPVAPNDPTDDLRLLVHKMEAVIRGDQRKLRWCLLRPNVGKPNLHLRDFSWQLNKIKEERYDPKPSILDTYYKLSRILENDELALLGLCRVCIKFFVLQRPWQKCCSARCKKTLDNRLYTQRKAQRTGSQAKARVIAALSDDKLVKRLHSTPHGRWRVREALIAQLKAARSLDAFWAACEPDIRRTMQNYLENKS